MGCGFVQRFGQVVAIVVKTFTNTHLVPVESASLKNVFHGPGYSFENVDIFLRFSENSKTMVMHLYDRIPYRACVMLVV